MMVTPDLVSLNLVKAEVDTTLTQVEEQIGTYMEKWDNPDLLATCVEALDQVLGAMRFVKLQGAVELALAMTQLMRQIQTNGPDASDENFAALGQGVMVLGRYLEYVLLRRASWPQLLLPTINQVRSTLGQAPLPESFFFPLSQLPSILLVVKQLEVTPVQLNALVRRLRLMYQTGLVPVLRDHADVPHFRMMSRACERAQQICGQRPMGVLWWVASAMIEALQQGVPVNDARKALLGRFDRQLKALLLNDGNAKPDLRLISDSLYVVGLAEAGQKVSAVSRAFGLDTICLTQSQLTAEYEFMCGPGGSVIKTVADVLRDELTQIKDTLELMSRGAKNDAESYQVMANNVSRTAQMLVILGLLDASQAMRMQAEEVRKWTGEPDLADMGALADTLMDVDDAVAELVKRSTPGSDTQVHNSRVSIHQLDEACSLLLAESRSGLSVAEHAISAYLDSSGDLAHLTDDDVVSTLLSVAGSLSFLTVDGNMIGRARAVLYACAHYIEARMLNAEQQPNIADLETLADVISSVDYFLEGLETNKPIGESIMEVAEDSMTELGFPVATEKVS